MAAVMKILVLFSFCFLFSKVSAQTNVTEYDSVLAKNMGADDYGMKKYIFCILKTGENKSTDKNHRDSCFAGHMSNIGRLVEDKKLIIAGPFFKNDDDFRGLFILNSNSTKEAEEILQTDPAIKEKYLYPILYEWYGSAALPMYIPFIESIQKTKF